MTFDTTWDVNKYRYKYEMLNHWKLKERFINAHKNKFPENELICLAQTYYNVEVMGCTYDHEIMEKMRELSVDLNDESLKGNDISYIDASNAIMEKYRDKTNLPNESNPNNVRNKRKYVPFVKEGATFIEGGTYEEKRVMGNNSTDVIVIDDKSEGSSQEPPFRREKLSNKRTADVDNRPSKAPFQQRNRGNESEYQHSERPSGVGFVGGNVTSGNQRQSVWRAYNSSSYPVDNRIMNYENSAGIPLFKLGNTQRGFNDEGSGSRNKYESNGQWYGKSGGTVGRRHFEEGTNYDKRGIRTPNKEFGGYRDQSRSNYYKGSSDYVDSRKPESLRDPRRSKLASTVKQVMESGPFGKIVLFESADRDEVPATVIQRTTSACHIVTDFSYSLINNVTFCRMMLDGIFIASGEGKSQKSAKENACSTAIQRLKETSFTVKMKAPFVGPTVNRSLEHDNNEQTGLDKPLEEDNIGRKMLRLMGWSGGGLGRNEQGIEEPVNPTDYSVTRAGLGIENIVDFRQKVTKLLEDYVRKTEKEDLIFSADFTKEERKIIHEMVRRFNLKSRSYGKEEDNRQLVVFKKVTPREIVDELVDCGGETDKYLLIPPTSVII